jgi:phage shock protein E
MPSDITPKQYVEREPRATTVDVRTPEEFSQGHLENALHADFKADDFEQRFEALGLEKDQTVYLYCGSGNRSGQAAQRMRDRGYTQLVNAGGFKDLAEAGEPVGRK